MAEAIARTGLPLLSGPPPDSSTHPDACRKCNKEFNIIFTRSRKCNHCGYSYCHSCTDYQALSPRPGGYDPVPVCGFCIEFLNVTATGKSRLKQFPLSKLKKYVTAYNIKITTAVEKDDLIDGILAARGPNGCLPPVNEEFYRRYSVPNRVPPGRPRGLFSRSSEAPPPVPPQRPVPSPTYNFPRPDLAPDDPPPQEQPSQSGHPQSYPGYAPQYTQPPPPPPRPTSQYTQAPPQHNFHNTYAPPPGPSPQNHGYTQGGGYPGAHYSAYQRPPQYGNMQTPTPPPAPPRQSRPPQPPPQQQDYYHSHRPANPPASTRPTPTPTSQPPPPPPNSRPRASSAAPPPGLDQMIEMSPESIGSLSISALKSILFTNHVNAGQILEKGDLVKKVLGLVQDEKAERERQRRAEELEEMERLQREDERRQEEEDRRRERQGREVHHESDHQSSPPSDSAQERSTDAEAAKPSSSTSTPSKPVPAPSIPKMSTLERNGLCVVCQDEEANIAIVDCGHLAMCRGCSDLIMASSRECPLCRTRIVTEARLLRIFKT